MQEHLENSLLSSFQALDKLGYRDEVADMLYYLYNEENLTDSTQFWSFLHRKFSPDIEEKVMTLGQQAVKQAAEQTAIRMLEEKIDIKLISKITNLSQEEIKRLQKKPH